MRLSLLITLCLAQTLSHPVSVSLEAIETIQEELTSLEADTASSLEHTLQSINELKRLLRRMLESHVVPEKELMNQVAEQEKIVATSEDDSWWENQHSESERREEELRREEEVIAEHERREEEEADTVAVEVVAEPADVLEQLDDLISDATVQENNILEEESFDPVEEEREEQLEDEVQYEENEDQVSEEDMAISEETGQVVEPVYDSEPEPEPEPAVHEEETEVDPRQAEEDAAEAYLKELGFD